MSATEDDFAPLRHGPYRDRRGRVSRAVRLLIDFQVRTVTADVRLFLRSVHGTLVDVGAGGRPYEDLVPRSTRYVALDIIVAPRFGYRAPSVFFDGREFPIRPASVDHVLCSEVLEHVEQPEPFVAELFRILKPAGTALITVPWSARYHYIPLDFHRFTPARLARLFSAFERVQIHPRGTDLTVIPAKVLLAYARLFRARGMARLVALLGAVVFAPLVPAALLVGHLSISLGLGSKDDPLGYTVLLEKRIDP